MAYQQTHSTGYGSLIFASASFMHSAPHSCNNVETRSCLYSPSVLIHSITESLKALLDRLSSSDHPHRLQNSSIWPAVMLATLSARTVTCSSVTFSTPICTTSPSNHCHVGIGLWEYIKFSAYFCIQPSDPTVQNL